MSLNNASERITGLTAWKKFCFLNKKLLLKSLSRFQRDVVRQMRTFIAEGRSSVLGKSIQKSSEIEMFTF